MTLRYYPLWLAWCQEDAGSQVVEPVSASVNKHLRSYRKSVEVAGSEAMRVLDRLAPYADIYEASLGPESPEMVPRAGLRPENADINPGRCCA